MTDTLRSPTCAVRLDPLDAPTPQTLAPWLEGLAFLQHLAARPAAGTAFRLVETPGQLACVVAEAPAVQLNKRTKTATAFR